MPRHAKGARLYLRRASGRFPATWIIRDGGRTVRTGCGPQDRGAAEQRLAAYIADKHAPDRTRGRGPAQIAVVDVLNIYLVDIGASLARSKEIAQRVRPLIDFFGEMTLADINGAKCRDYARQRPSPSMTKRELEDLRAAVNHHRGEGLCDAVVEIVVPRKAEPRDRWLTKAEMAAFLFKAWRYREVQKGMPTGRRSRRHIARFALVGLYTGRRAAAIYPSISDIIAARIAELESGREPQACHTESRLQ